MTPLQETLFTSYLKSLDALQAEPEQAFDLDRNLREYPALKTVLESSPSLCFILDYRTGKYYYFSANAQQIAGQKQEAFIQDGLELTLHIYHQEDARLYYNNIFSRRLAFMHRLKPEERGFYSYQHNFRIGKGTKAGATLLQEHRVLKADAGGNPLVIMGFCTDITCYKTGTRMLDAIILRKPGEPSRAVETHYHYPRPEEGLLTSRELEILKWILEGLSSKAIADKMHISTHTVRTHRKHMHEKTNARNIADLLRFALGHGLL